MIQNPVGHEPQESGPPKVVRPMVDDTRIWPAGYTFSSLSADGRPELLQMFLWALGRR